MKTLTLEAEITIDGSLHLDIPSSGLPPGKAEVVLVIQPPEQTNRFAKTGYEWLLDPNLDILPAPVTQANNAEPFSQLTRAERFQQMDELLEIALQGVAWAEIKEARRSHFQLAAQHNLLSVELLTL